MRMVEKTNYSMRRINIHCVHAAPRLHTHKHRHRHAHPPASPPARTHARTPKQINKRRSQRTQNRTIHTQTRERDKAGRGRESKQRGTQHSSRQLCGRSRRRSIPTTTPRDRNIHARNSTATTHRSWPGVTPQITTFGGMSLAIAPKAPLWSSSSSSSSTPPPIKPPRPNAPALAAAATPLPPLPPIPTPPIGTTAGVNGNPVARPAIRAAVRMRAFIVPIACVSAGPLRRRRQCHRRSNAAYPCGRPMTGRASRKPAAQDNTTKQPKWLED